MVRGRDMDTTNYSAPYAGAEGHDPGHLPVGLTWADVVHAFVREQGGWAPLSAELVRRAGPGVELPRDLGSIERGLRRLADRGQRDGGQYGRWLERFFGMPAGIEPWLRWLGQYHRRFADLPVSMRERQLALWDRPPVRDSVAGAWIDLGVASVAMRKGDRAGVDARLARAATKLGRAGAALCLEHHLLAARVASDDHDRAAVARWIAHAEPLLESPELSAEDAACYRARHLDAIAYRLLHPHEGEARIDEARARYEAIPMATGVAFVDLRRALGLGYCAYRSGDRASAVRLCLEAAEHAADGGLVRFRVMSFNLASRAADEPEASRFRERARRLSVALEDEDLRARVER